MKKSWKYGLIGAAAALAAVLLPYEIDRNDDGEFSYNSLLLGVYRRKRSDGEHATAVTLFNAPALTDESRKAREAAVRHVIEAAAERELFADEDDPTEGAASVSAALPTGGFVILDTALTPDLEAEGYARDVIRAVQDARKAADFDVADRISLKLAVPEGDVAKVEQFRELIASETLATSFEVTPGAELNVEVAKA